MADIQQELINELTGLITRRLDSEIRNQKPDYTTNSDSYYKELARKEALIELLATKIIQYEMTLNNRLADMKKTMEAYIAELDRKLASFDQSVMNLLRKWIDDGTFAQVINEEIFAMKLDTTVYERNKRQTDEKLDTLMDLFLSAERVVINYNDTLAVLNNDQSADQTKNYVITNKADSENYGYVVYYNGSTWVRGWVFNAFTLGDRSVQVKHTDFLTDVIAYDSKYDAMPFVLSRIGQFYDPANGREYELDRFKNTGRIYPKGKALIETHGVNSYVFYDHDDQFISSSEHGSDDNLSKTLEIPIPDNTYYFIGNIPKPYWWDKDDTEYPNLSARMNLVPIKQRMKVLRLDGENLEKMSDVSFIPKNIFNEFELSNEGYAINALTGITNVQANRKHSEYKELPHVQYATFGIANIIFKDKDGNFIPESKIYSSDVAQSTWQLWTLPKNAVYVAFNLFPFYYDRAEIFQMESTQKKVHIKETLNEARLNQVKRFMNETILHLGDSIVGNYSYPSDAPTYIRNVTGATVINGGFGGTRASAHPNKDFNSFSFYEMAKAIVSGDFSKQTASSFVTGIGMPPYFKTKITTVANVDYSKLFMIVLSYGTNDWNGVVPLDNPSDLFDVNTYLGSIRYGIKIINEKYPHIKFILSTPIYRFKEDNSEDSDTWMAGTKKLTDFVNGLKDIENSMHVPVIDCYHTLGINKYNKLHYFHKADGTHPTWRGRRLLGHKIADGITQNY